MYLVCFCVRWPELNCTVFGVCLWGELMFTVPYHGPRVILHFSSVFIRSRLLSYRSAHLSLLVSSHFMPKHISLSHKSSAQWPGYKPQIRLRLTFVMNLQKWHTTFILFVKYIRRQLYGRLKFESHQWIFIRRPGGVSRHLCGDKIGYFFRGYFLVFSVVKTACFFMESRSTSNHDHSNNYIKLF